MKITWKFFGKIAGLIALIVVVGFAFLYSGVYNVGADSPHTRLVFWLLDTARDRSVSAHASQAPAPPDLTDTKRISTGAGIYGVMCSDCHLAPGMERTEIAQGLYPKAPELARGDDLTPQEQFWVIKHGIKASGMAAWGKTHDDSLIWDMVAFVRKMPSLTEEQYRELANSAPEDHDEIMVHQHVKNEH